MPALSKLRKNTDNTGTGLLECGARIPAHRGGPGRLGAESSDRISEGYRPAKRFLVLATAHEQTRALGIS